MKKYFLLSLLAILTLTASAQTNTYAMVIEMQNGTKLTIGPNEVKNVTFNNGELTVTGETIETLVASAVNQAKEYTDQAAANLKGYIDLSRELAELKAASEAADESIRAELAAKQTLIETNDAAIMALLDTKFNELNKLIDSNAKDILANAKAISDNKAAQDAANIIMQNNIAQNAKDNVAQGKDITNLDDAIKAIKKALGDDTAETLKAYAKSIAESNAYQAKLDAQSYADTKDAAQSQTLMQAIKDQAEQDAKAWTSAMNLSIENLVTTYKLASLNEIISARINEAIVNLIQTYNLQKP